MTEGMTMGDVYVGNKFVITDNSGIWLDSQAKKLSYKFTAQHSKSVTSVFVVEQVMEGTSPTYRIGLQLDVNGLPSGTWLGATNKGYGDIQFTGAAPWNEITLTESVPLTKGKEYHLVIQWQSGTINGNNRVAFNVLTPINNVYPFDQSPCDYQVLFYSSSWVEQDKSGACYVKFSDNSYEGEPYYVFSEYSIYDVGGSERCGQKFTLSNHITVSKFGFYGRKIGSPDNLTYILYNITDSITVETGVINASSISNADSWQELSFNQKRDLSGGKAYRLTFYSPNSNSSNCYKIKVSSVGGTTVRIALSYDGASSCFVYQDDLLTYMDGCIYLSGMIRKGYMQAYGAMGKLGTGYQQAFDNAQPDIVNPANKPTWSSDAEGFTETYGGEE